ncbi:DUF3147 family protein [Blastomonas marina]|uniref:DUF3147 family protein n=1 Tax=Blastomonas marina TaxID=1867408 RepID=UPI002AC9B954|nr:DUF3147 family protein [Blastomonas marina]WPZ04863.1 DUF3147 family protein [Blastomonas marina]
MDWGYLATKALVSGVLIALASEISRRNPGVGGLIASLPLVSTLALVWLWRDTGDKGQVADLAIASTLYVIGSLPAFLAIALMLRNGVAFIPTLLAGIAVGFAGYWSIGRIGGALGWPV